MCAYTFCCIISYDFCHELIIILIAYSQKNCRIAFSKLQMHNICSHRIIRNQNHKSPQFHILLNHFVLHAKRNGAELFTIVLLRQNNNKTNKKSRIIKEQKKKKQTQQKRKE